MLLVEFDHNVNVTISVPGVFHAFHLARQLETRRALNRIYTTFPRFALDTDGIPDDAIHSIRHPEFIMQLGERFPSLNRLPTTSRRPFEQWKNRLFDRAVAKRLEFIEDGIFVGFAGCSLRSLRRANDLGLTTVVERASSHKRTQARLLQEEYQKFGLRPPITEQEIQHEEKEYEEADYVMVPSQFVYESFLDHDFPEEKLLCTPFGAAIPDISPPESTQNFTFIFSGHINLRKGVHYLLEAWQEASLADSELIITSGMDDHMKPIIESYRSEPSIKFVGWVDDLSEWMRNASVFVFPSLEEGSARVTYEAMAHGLPLITTFNSGWVGNDEIHGLEVPIRDVDALREALEYMYYNRGEATQMGLASRALIESKFTWKDYGIRVYDQYESIA